MPPPEVKRGSDGKLVIYDGVTRATCAAKYLPGTPDPCRGDRWVDLPGRRIAEGRRQTMRSTELIWVELLAALSQLSRLRPEWRLGQTLANLAMTAGRLEPGGVWDLEDEEALAAARTLIEQYSEIEPGAAEPVADSARQEDVAGSPARIA